MIALYILLFTLIYVPILALMGFILVQAGVDLGAYPNTIALLISSHLAAFIFLKRRHQPFRPTQFVAMLLGCSIVNALIQIGGAALVAGLGKLSGRWGEFVLILLGQSACICLGLFLGTRLRSTYSQPNP